jgi:hypothetical protein
MGTKWTQAGPGTLVTGRSGSGQAYQFGASGSPFITLPNGPYNTITCGIAYQTQAFANSIFVFSDATTGGNRGLDHVGDGRLRVSFGSPRTAPSAFVMNLNQWYYIECQFVGRLIGVFPSIDYTVKVNGGVILSGTLSWDIGDSVFPTTASITCSAPGGGANAIIDDFYVTDAEFLGDVNIVCLYPNADGDLSAWTPLSAGSHYLMTQEHPADEDTTYIFSSTAGNQELENLQDIGGAVAHIFGGQFLWRLKKSNAGPATVQGAIKSSGVTVNTPTYFPSADNYLYLIQPYRKSPFTGNDFTVPEINAIQMGPTRIS